MKNIKKIGLSALAGALAITSAHAGAISVTGNMEVSYTKGGGQTTTGNPLGQANDLTFAGSGELDNGVTVAYSRSVTDGFAADDSELVFGNILGGTIAFQSTGSPLDGIDNKTPTAFRDAEGATGSINDVTGANGDFGIRYTLDDVGGTGFKIDYNWVPTHGSGDATGDEGYAVGAVGAKDAHDIAITGSVPGIEGLSIGAGYAKKNYDLTTGYMQKYDAGTVYATYAVGGITVGYQVGAVGHQGTAPNAYKNNYLGVSYAVSDDLSISYNNTESKKMGGAHGFQTVEQDWDSISLSYVMGGMTINIADSDCGNCSYTSAKKETERTVSVTIAF